MIMTRRIADVSITPNAGITWADIRDLDPRLPHIEHTALSARTRPGGRCHMDTWYGWFDERQSRRKVGLKARLGRIVGWYRVAPGGIEITEEFVPEHESVTIVGGKFGPPEAADPSPLGTQRAYERAYEYLFTRLLPCRACGCGVSGLESDVEQLLVDRLEAFGHSVERQVWVGVGRADVVTADAVYEVKRELTRSALFAAIGQVLVYASALGKPRRVVVGLRSKDRVDDLIAQARLAGVEVETW